MRKLGPPIPRLSFATLHNYSERPLSIVLKLFHFFMSSRTTGVVLIDNPTVDILSLYTGSATKTIFRSPA